MSFKLNPDCLVFLSADVGNRITALSKVMGRLHSEMKVVQQLLVKEGFNGKDGAPQEGSSILGKYILGAKNNFKDFNKDQPEKTLPVTVHQGLEKEAAHQEQEEDRDRGVTEETPQKTPPERGAGGGPEKGPESVALAALAACVIINMEESGGPGPTEDEREETADATEPEPAAIAENTASASTGEATHEDANGSSAGQKAAGEAVAVAVAVGGGEAKEERWRENLKTEDGKTEKKSEYSADKSGSTARQKPSEEKADASEAKETGAGMSIEVKGNPVEPKVGKEKKQEADGAKKTVAWEDSGKPGKVKVVPSPTGSSSSQDTGFGSQEGEGSMESVSGRR